MIVHLQGLRLGTRCEVYGRQFVKCNSYYLSFAHVFTQGQRAGRRNCIALALQWPTSLEESVNILRQLDSKP